MEKVGEGWRRLEKVNFERACVCDLGGRRISRQQDKGDEFQTPATGPELAISLSQGKPSKAAEQMRAPSHSDNVQERSKDGDTCHDGAGDHGSKGGSPLQDFATDNQTHQMKKFCF